MITGSVFQKHSDIRFNIRMCFRSNLCPGQSVQVLRIFRGHPIFQSKSRPQLLPYVHTDEKKKVTINESFVGFTAVKDTPGKDLTDTLTGVLDNLGLEFANCRVQSYGNGSNMRGIHKGVQALIQQRCPEALFIPCCSHSLNLLLCDAVSSNRGCLTSFGTLQRLYTIFSSSVRRWDILTEFVDITLKPLSDTLRWAKLDSVKAVRF